MTNEIKMKINYQNANVKNILEEVSKSEIEKGYGGISAMFSGFSLQYIQQIAQLEYDLLPILLGINKRYSKNAVRRQRVDDKI